VHTSAAYLDPISTIDLWKQNQLAKPINVKFLSVSTIHKVF